jgi:hypothetical protein
MAFTKALVQRRKWILIIGLALEAVAILLRARGAGLALALFGIGLCFLALSDLYRDSSRTKRYDLFPKSGKQRTP